MKIRSWLLGVIVLVIVIGGIGLTMAFNLWRTEGAKEPMRLNQGEFAGEYNPADIRGSYSLGDISKLFEIPLAELVAAFGLEDIDNPENFKNSELESLYSDFKETEIGTDSVRVFVALYTGLPYTLSESAYLPQPAIEILKTKSNLTLEQAAFLDTHGVDVSDLEPISKPGETEQNDVKEPEPSIELSIKGNITFGELLDWGLSEGDIAAIIGDKLPDRSIKVRDYAVNRGIEFSLIKAALQEKVDALP